MPLIRNLSEVEKAYIAGIIDGEGCISIAKRKVKYITPSLQISGTNKRGVTYAS